MPYNNDASRYDDLADAVLSDEPWAGAENRDCLKDLEGISFDTYATNIGIDLAIARTSGVIHNSVQPVSDKYPEIMFTGDQTRTRPQHYGRPPQPRKGARTTPSIDFPAGGYIQSTSRSARARMPHAEFRAQASFWLCGVKGHFMSECMRPK